MTINIQRENALGKQDHKLFQKSHLLSSEITISSKLTFLSNTISKNYNYSKPLSQQLFDLQREFNYLKLEFHYWKPTTGIPLLGSTINNYMFPQAGFVIEPFTTMRTWKWFFSGMFPHMDVHVAFLQCSIRTHGALESYVGVHIQLEDWICRKHWKLDVL